MLNWTTGPAALAHAVGKLRVTHVITSQKAYRPAEDLKSPASSTYSLKTCEAGSGKGAEALATLLATYVTPHHFLGSGATTRSTRCPGRRPDPAVVPVHSWIGERAQGGPAEPPEPGHERAGRAARPGRDLRRCHAGLPAPLPRSFGFDGGKHHCSALLQAGFGSCVTRTPPTCPGWYARIVGYRPTLLLHHAYVPGLHLLRRHAGRPAIPSRNRHGSAEKSPEAIFGPRAELAPGATILEAYGITECSPMVAANQIGRTKAGTVGLPVAGVEVCVVDPESKQLLPAGSTGILLVRGPSVFRGYLAYDGPDPFLTVNGHRWYYTGDLVQFDDEGFIHFRGRLKRFLKAGGEMISLPAWKSRWPGFTRPRRRTGRSGGGRDRNPGRPLDRAVHNPGSRFAPRRTPF